MDLVGENIKASQEPEFNLFSDPLAFYIYVLISTNSANTMTAIVDRFSGMPEVLGYVKKTLISMEGIGAIEFADGTYRVGSVFSYHPVDRNADNSFLPSLFSKVTRRVMKDVAAGTNDKKSSIAQFYYLPDSPIKRAKVDALIVEFSKKLKDIIENDYASDPHPTRFVALVSSVADAEDLI